MASTDTPEQERSSGPDRGHTRSDTTRDTTRDTTSDPRPGTAGEPTARPESGAESDSADSDPLRALDPTLYGDLRAIAGRALRTETAVDRPGTTSLVHEVWLRIAQTGPDTARDREHLLAIASRVARHALVDAAKRRNAAKRAHVRVDLAAADPFTPTTPDEILAIDELLDRLAHRYPRQAKALEMRIFGGISPDRIAAALGLSASQVKRDVTFAGSWIRKALGDDPPASEPAQPAAGDAPPTPRNPPA